MTLEPRPTTPVVPAELRSRVRRQATALEGRLPLVVAGAIAVALMLLFTMMDYRLDQDVHRLIKIAAALPVVLLIAVQPTFGLMIFPISAPFLILLPELPIPGLNTLNAMLLGVFGAWFLMRVMSRQPIGRRFWLGWPMLAVVLIMTISLVRAAASPPVEYDTYKGFLLLFRNVTTFIPYFITVMMVRSRKDSGRLFWAVVAGLLAESVVTVWFGEWTSGGRAKGTMNQPNALGAYLSISTVLVGSFLLAQRQWLARGIALATFALGFYATLQSVSRGAMISIAVGLTYVAVRSSRLLTVLVAVALLTSPIWAPDSVKERVMSTQQQDEESDEVELEGSTQARLDTWQATLHLASSHLIEGVGFGVLPYILIDTGKKMGLGHTHESTHNSFLRMLGEMGIPGLLVYVILLASCWALGMAGQEAARDRYEHQLAIGLQAALFTVGVNCWFGDRFFELDIMCAFWMVCAMVNDFVIRNREGVT